MMMIHLSSGGKSSPLLRILDSRCEAAQKGAWLWTSSHVGPACSCFQRNPGFYRLLTAAETFERFNARWRRRRWNEKTTEARSRPQPKSLILMSGAGGLEIYSNNFQPVFICFGLTVLICIREGLKQTACLLRGDPQYGVGRLVR